MKHFNLIKTFLLLFALVVGGGSSAWADNVTVSFISSSDVGTGTTASGQNSITKAGITISCTAGGFAISGGAHYRLGSGSTTTISSTVGKIQSIVINGPSGTGSNSISKFGANAGWTLDSSKGTYTWSGDATSVSVKANSGQVRPTSIIVTYSPTSSISIPTFSVSEGAVEKGTNLAISTATEGADIYYTTDNTTPTSGSTKYIDGITINSAMTIKAIAIKGSESSVVATASYTIKKVEAPTFSLSEGFVLEGATLELSTTTEGATIHYTTDGSLPTVSSSTYSSPISINSDVTIKAIAVKNNWDDSEVASATYNVLTPIHGLSVDFESNDVSRYADWTFNNIVCAKAITAHSGTYYGSTDGKSTASITTKAKVANPYSITCYISKESGNTTACNWKIEVSEDDTNWSAVATISASSMDKGDWVKFSADLTSYSNVYVRLSYGSNTAKRAVDDIVLTTYEPITISSAGYATYCSSAALDFTGITTLTAYTATKDVDGVMFNKVEGKVPANTGLLVSGETTNVPVCASADPVTNLLVGVTTETVKDAGTVFVLMNGSKGIGFYKNSNAFTVRANSAYLPAEAVETAGARTFIGFDDEATGIAEVNTQKDNAKRMFDLQGRKVTKAAKGLYIVDGRKVVVK